MVYAALIIYLTWDSTILNQRFRQCLARRIKVVALRTGVLVCVYGEVHGIVVDRDEEIRLSGGDGRVALLEREE